MRSDAVRRVITLFAAALIVGGLVRLATDETPAEVATGDMSRGSKRAASSEREPLRDTAATRSDALDAAIVSMLSHSR